MKILWAKAKNFGSYEELYLDFTSMGFRLIEGPTGSGKSTLCDVIPWVLFGKTAKNGLADDVLPWGQKVDTTVEMCVQKDDKELLVKRVRGKKSDLYIQVDDKVLRGKDNNDTQDLINRTLGMTIEFYLAGSYYHEFSQTAQFFTTSAKNRRVICEQIVDLSLSVLLQEKLAEELKLTNKDLEGVETLVNKSESELSFISSALVNNQKKARQWRDEHQEKILSLRAKQDNWALEHLAAVTTLQENYDKFETQTAVDMKKAEQQLYDVYDLLEKETTSESLIRETLSAIVKKDNFCPTCGQVCKTDEHKKEEELKIKLNNCDWNINKLTETCASLEQKIKTLQNSVNPFKSSLEFKKAEKNTYGEQAADLMKVENPFADLIREAKDSQQSLKDHLNFLYKEQEELADQVNDLETLKEIFVKFRAELIKFAVSSIEQKTNEFVRQYFSSEFTVNLSVEKADAIDIEIYKDGNICSYSQLSKGQRGILKLCFSTAVMEIVKTNSGNSIPVLFYDEALDGLDETFKMQAVKMLEAQSIKYDSLFLVDHSEAVKAQVTDKITVKYSKGHSRICQH